MSQSNHHFLNLYRTYYNITPKDQKIIKRRELLNIINGDTFYPLSKWPLDLKLIFWKKTISDKNTFKLFLFFIGNGGSPHLAGDWIMTSQAWAPQHTKEK